MTERRKAYTDAKRWAESFDHITELRKSGLMWKEITAQYPWVTASIYSRYVNYHGLTPVRLPRPAHRAIPEWYQARHRRMRVAIEAAGGTRQVDWENVADRFGFASSETACHQFHSFAKRLDI